MNRKKNSKNHMSGDDQILTLAVRGGFWVILARIAVESILLIKLIIFARILSPEDFGLFGITILLYDTFNIFSRTGFASALIQKKENIKPYLNSAWTVQIIRGFILFIILFLIAPVAAFYFTASGASHRASEATLAIQVIGVSFIIEGFTNIGFTYFLKELQFNKRFTYQLAGTLTDFILSIVIAIFWGSVWAIIIAMLAGQVAKCFASYFMHPYKPHLSSNFRRVKDLWSFGKWIFASSICGFLILEADDIFLGLLLGVTSLGLYQLAYKISNLSATETAGVLKEVTFPAYSKLQEDLPKIREGFLKILKITATLSFLIAGLILVFAFDFTKIFLGENWLPMVTTMQVLVLWGIIRAIGGSTFAIFRGIGKPEIVTKLQIIQLILMTILIYPLTTQYKIFGTALAVFFSAFITIWVNYFVTFRVVKFKKLIFLKIIFLSLVNMLIMVSCILIVRIYWILSVGLIELCMLGAFALLIYICIILIFEKLFDYKIIKEARYLYKQLMKQ